MPLSVDSNYVWCTLLSSQCNAFKQCWLWLVIGLLTQGHAFHLTFISSANVWVYSSNLMIFQNTMHHLLQSAAASSHVPALVQYFHIMLCSTAGGSQQICCQKLVHSTGCSLGYSHFSFDTHG